MDVWFLLSFSFWYEYLTDLLTIRKYINKKIYPSIGRLLNISSTFTE